MQLTSKNVSDVMLECLFADEEMDTTTGFPKGGVKAVHAQGIVLRVGFHKERLEARREDVRSMLDQLPDEFRETVGGGWSFLNMCNTRDGVQWGEHRNMDELLTLGLALGLMEIQVPRSSWRLFPGGVPYVAYVDRICNAVLDTTE